MQRTLPCLGALEKKWRGSGVLDCTGSGDDGWGAGESRMVQKHIISSVGKYLWDHHVLFFGRTPPCGRERDRDTKCYVPAFLKRLQGQWLHSRQQLLTRLPLKQTLIFCAHCKALPFSTWWNKFRFLVLLAGLYSMRGGSGSWFGYFEWMAWVYDIYHQHFLCYRGKMPLLNYKVILQYVRIAIWSYLLHC